MPYSPNNPLIVQSDRSVLLEVQNDRYEAARDALARFAELQKSPEFIHTYRITPLSLWNAAAAGLSADQILADLSEYAKFDVPENVIFDIRESIGRYGRVRLEKNEDGLLILTSADVALLTELTRRKELKPYLLGQLDANTLLVIDDNNFPFSVGRHKGSGKPDDNEFVLIKLPEALPVK